MSLIEEASNNLFNDLGEGLLRFKKDQKYLVYDTESCNLNLVWEENVPWEWAWILCTQNEILEKKSYLVQWPTINIAKEAALVTGFYAKKARIPIEGKSPEFVISEFDKLLYDEDIIVVAHNGLNFDVYLHQIHRKLTGRPPDFSYLPRFLDTNALARALKLELTIPKNKDELLAFQYQMAGHRTRGLKTNLGVMCEHFGLAYDKALAHDALYDCDRLREVLLKMIYSLEIYA